MRQITILFFLLINVYAFAQPTGKFTGSYSQFHQAEDLYEKQQYGSARMMFREFIQAHPNANDPFYIKALYYEAISALELFHNDAIPMLERFNKNYPENIYKQQIYFRIGRYYYQKKEYKTTIDWFTKIRKYDLDTVDRDEYLFKLGHSYFNENKFEEAKLQFVDVKDNSSQYAGPSLYYFSHISYQQKLYKVALEGFEKLLDDPRFSRIVPYYITQIYYLLGDYKSVTTMARQLSDSLKPNNVNDMNQLIGDAFYRTNQFDEAIFYLEKYNKTHETSREEDYQLGYAYFRSQSYPKAIKLFDKVTKESDSLAQIAFYHIAESYLKSNDLLGARNAFDRASRMKFDKKIEEDALYNFAILSYKVDFNPYNEAVLALHDYLEKYPKSDRVEEVYNCLISVYTTTHRFQDALTSLEKFQLKDVRLKSAYQIVAFNLAVEKFQKGEYKDAITTFQLVRKYPIDEHIINQSHFWTADAYYRLKNYDKSIEYFESFVKFPGNSANGLRSDAFYNLGYCYLNKKQYEKEEEALINYIESPVTKPEKLFDAYLRLGDVSYMLRKNEAAIAYYEKATKFNNPQRDHAYYYMALTYGLKDNGSQEKINALNSLIKDYPRSSYALASMYEIGTTYRSIKQEDKALTYFERIINEYPGSNFELSSKLNRASIHLSLRNFAKAESEYKTLLKEYQKDNDVCMTAVEGLTKLYTAQKDIDKIATLSVYPCAKNVENQIEETYYYTAIEPYLDSNYSAAIPNLQSYLAKFPNGKYTAEMTAYLANSYQATNQNELAIATYEDVLSFPKNGYTETAASITSKHYYNAGNYEKANQYYKQLDESTVNVSAKYQAAIGLMRTNFILKNYADAATAAQRVSSNTITTKDVLLESEYVKGTSNYFLKNYSAAITSLEYTVKNAKNATANEAKFYLGDIAYEEGKYDAADTHVKELLKIKPAYDFWTAKGLMLQVKAYIKKDDLFKAEQTLKSVIDNYKYKDDGILEEADALWAELMQIKNMPKPTSTKTINVIELDENGK